VKAWKTATEPLHRQWADAVARTGADPAALDREFQADVAKAGAGF
jgi:hypothetical protein